GERAGADGQVRALLDNLDGDALGIERTAGRVRSAWARLSSSRIAFNCRCSKSLTVRPRQRAAARMTATYISLSTGRLDCRRAANRSRGTRRLKTREGR